MNEGRRVGREKKGQNNGQKNPNQPTEQTNKRPYCPLTRDSWLCVIFFFKGSFSNVKETALSARMHRAVLDKCGRVYNRILRLTKVGRTTRRPRRRGKS